MLGCDETVTRSAPPRKPSVRVLVYDEPDPREVELTGRPAELLVKLYGAGSDGLTTAQLQAGLRVSHYVMCLRRAGLAIETIPEEANGVRFGRYVLRSKVTILQPWERAA